MQADESFYNLIFKIMDKVAVHLLPLKLLSWLGLYLSDHIMIQFDVLVYSNIYTVYTYGRQVENLFIVRWKQQNINQ